MNRLNPWVLVGLILTELPLAIWGGASVFVMAVALHVPAAIAWVPSVALGGVMLSSTMFSIQPGVDTHIRRYAGGLAALAIIGEVIVAGAQHYFAAKAPVGQAVEILNPNPWWGFVLGGLPSAMGGALIHITAMYFAQRRREKAERDTEEANLETARGIRAMNATEEAQAARLRHEARRGEETDATRSRQAVATELRQAKELRAELAGVLTGIREANTAIDEARREQERLRSRQRRQRDKTTPGEAASQPVSQPVSQDPHAASQPVSRDDRRRWAREQLENGVDLRGSDIDKQFGPPRNGAHVLREARAELGGRMEGELSVISGGPGGR